MRKYSRGFKAVYGEALPFGHPGGIAYIFPETPDVLEIDKVLECLMMLSESRDRLLSLAFGKLTFDAI